MLIIMFNIYIYSTNVHVHIRFFKLWLRKTLEAWERPTTTTVLT